MESILYASSLLRIDSDCGRIGPFWWLNSDTEPMQFYGEDYVRWGSFGFGPHPGHVVLRAVNRKRHSSQSGPTVAEVASKNTNG